MILIEGNSNDEDNELTLTPQEARYLAGELERAAEGSEDHRGIYEVKLVSLNMERRHHGRQSNFTLQVNPHLG
jgi:hypothetical protein